MLSKLTSISVFLSLLSFASANLDVVSLYVRSGNYITEADATLVLGQLPSSTTGDVALWSAIMLDQDFLQGVTSNSPAGSYCGASASKSWCNFAYMLRGSSATAGDAVTASQGDRIRTHYKSNTSTKLWDHNLYINDNLVSTVSTSSGQKGGIFYVSMECASGTCAAAPAHQWENMSIVLNSADPSFGHSGGWEYGASGGVMSTPDSGKTWNFTTLKVPTTSF